MLVKDKVCLRKLNASDADELAGLANNKKVADNLRDIFPHPYSLKDAKDFISFCEAESPQLRFAITYESKLADVIGFLQTTDIYSKTEEIGYWLGEPFWNKGIATLEI